MKELKVASNSTTRYYLVTVNAVCMYTNIMKDEIINNIWKLLNEKFICFSYSFSIEKILEALAIILSYSIFVYGDSFWCQLKEIAIGTLTACIVVILFFAYNKVRYLIPTFLKWIIIFLHYIDDSIMI